MQARAMRTGTGSAAWVKVSEVAGVLRKLGRLGRLEPPVLMVAVFDHFLLPSSSIACVLVSEVFH